MSNYSHQLWFFPEVKVKIVQRIARCFQDGSLVWAIGRKPHSSASLQSCLEYPHLLTAQSI